MRKIFATAALCLGLITPAHAADKGAPAAPAGTVVESPTPRWQGLYLEGSATAANFKIDGLGTESFGYMGLGIGYDHRLAWNMVAGAVIRYDFGRDGDNRLLTLGARLGWLPNPHLMLYLPINYTIDGADISLSDGIFSAGVGLETYVAANITLFAEATRNIAAQGAGKLFDETTAFRGGVKFRF